MTSLRAWIIRSLRPSDSMIDRPYKRSLDLLLSRMALMILMGAGIGALLIFLAVVWRTI